MSTIYALASARGKAGVALIRISGLEAFSAARQLAGSLPAPGAARLRTLRGVDGTHLDEALILCFARGHSFTGEDVVEFHLHGSVAVVKAVEAELGLIDGLRLAEPGEFTRRALENGCLDLAQVEGLGDLIAAETEVQRRQALKVLSGALGRKAEAWRKQLVRAAALIEATIDFSDEDVPVDVSPEVFMIIDKISEDLQREAAGSRISERVRDGFEVAIVGAPNVGKSTLLNALAGREAAITSEYAGTTRDVIEVRMDLEGLPVTLLDTAGLREASDEVENIGIERGLLRAAAADLRVFLLDENDNSEEITAGKDDIIVQSKADLGRRGGFAVSAKTGEGLNELTARIGDVLERRAGNAATATHARHRNAIERAVVALRQARAAVESGPDYTELAAEELRCAIRSLESLVGRVGVEDILDEIFASFCLGK